MRSKVLLFDIDGTLILSGGSGKKSLDIAMAEAFDCKEPVLGVSLHGRTDRGIIRDLLDANSIEPTEENFQKLFSGYFRILEEMLVHADGEILPGITDLMHELSSRDDIVLGLLTGNHPHGAKLKLERFDLYRYFQFGGYGHNNADRNEVAQLALDAAIDFLNRPVDPKDVWVIGDTPNDIRCARAIGANAVAVATGTFNLNELKAERPDHLFPTLENVHEVMQLWI